MIGCSNKITCFFVNLREYQKDFPEPGVYSSKEYTMTETRTTLQAVIDQTLAANLNPIREFLLWKP